MARTAAVAPAGPKSTETKGSSFFFMVHKLLSVAFAGVKFSGWTAVSFTERTQVVAGINYFYEILIDVGGAKYGRASVKQYDRFGDKQPPIVTAFELDVHP